MSRVNLLKKDRKGSSKSNKTGNNIFERLYDWKVWFNGICLVVGLAIAGFFFIPYFSMHFMNNQAVTVNSDKVLFYSSDCDDCESIYPVVFWDNVIHGTDVQTINIKVIDNQHYVDDDMIMSTPTIIDFDNSKRISTTNKQTIKDFINN